MLDPPWIANRAEWLTASTTWIAQQVERLGLGSVVEVSSQKERPWGATLRVRTSARTVFFKAVGEGRQYEVVVTSAIADRWSGLTPDVLAVDVERSCILMSDHGTAIRDVLSPGRQVDVVAGLLPTYAEMQRATSPMTGEWIVEGAPDRRVSVLPEQLAAFLDGHGDRSQRDACWAALPLFSEVCARLSEMPVADAIEHADLHGTNVLFDGSEARLIDWGDACVTHPFTTLFVTFEFVVASLDAADREAAARRLRDAYLEPWGGPTQENVDAFDRALWVAPIVRVLSLANEADGDIEIDELLTAWVLRAPELARSWRS